jgi:FkbM family methyltransferase
MLRSLLKDIYAHGLSIRERVDELAGNANAHARWLDELLVRMFQLMHNLEQDNFDADRYRNVPANAFFADRHAAYFAFLLRNVEHFYRSRQLFEDETSRALYDQLILFRVLGHLHVRLPFNTAENRARLAIPASWRVEDTEDVGAFGPLSIFVVPGDGHDIRVKGWKENVTWTFLYRQYYFERDDVEIKPVRGDHVIDAGGCFGDTALGFADAVGKPGHVYVFDPLPKHCTIMRQQLVMNPTLAPRISIFPLGLADLVNDVAPLPDNDLIDPGARIVAGEMPIVTVDEIAARNNMPRVDFIKMDIEGSELDALRGAESTIRRWRPKLAVSLYHRPEDFFSIPSWIDSLGIGYRLFLDHYSIHHEETVLFATV